MSQHNAGIENVMYVCMMQGMKFDLLDPGAHHHRSEKLRKSVWLSEL